MVGGLEHFSFFHIFCGIFSQLTHVFQRGRSTTNQINGVITRFTPKGSQMIPGCHSWGWLHWGDLTMFPIFLNKFCGVKFQPYFCFFSILFQYFSYVLMFPIFEHMCRMRPLATSSSQKKGDSPSVSPESVDDVGDVPSNIPSNILLSNPIACH